MNCKYCGFTLEDGDESKYCPECGKPLYEEETAQNETDELNGNEEVPEDTNGEDMNDFEEDVDVYERPEAEVQNESAVHDSLTEDSMNTYPAEEKAKKNKGGAIIAAFAAVLVIGCVVVVFTISSLNKKHSDAADKKQPETAVNEPAGSEIEGEYIADDGVVGDYSSYSQYVTNLGTYVGVKVNMTPEAVTDEAVEKEVAAKLKSATTMEEIKDRTTVENGDVANIDFTGYIDGEEFEGGKGTTDLTIGSGQFIPGFEEGLIGAQVGETVDVEVTFPEDYKETTLAGKPATFKVTVNAIKQQVTPELNDDWVKNNSDFSNVADYKANVRKQMEDAAVQQAKDTKATRILETIYKDSTVTGYPEGEIDGYIKYMTSYYEYYASMLGTDLDGLIASYFGTTKEEFMEQLNSIAEANIGTEMVCYCIAAKEGMTLSDEEYQEAALQYAKDNGVETVEEFETKYSKSQIYDRIIMDRVMKYVSDNSVEVNE